MEPLPGQAERRGGGTPPAERALARTGVRMALRVLFEGLGWFDGADRADRLARAAYRARAAYAVCLGALAAALAGCGGVDAPRDDGPGEPSAAEGAGGSCLSGGQGGAPAEGGGPAEGAGSCAGPGARFATRVVSACLGEGQGFGQDRFPDVVLGPPRGGGCCGGSLDVLSLGDGGSIVVAFDGNAIIDGPGADFLVFENAFARGGDAASVFAELATVEVSEDGVAWSAFPCAADRYPYDGCAGWHPVHANPGENDVDPLDPSSAGGDPFDLADIGIPLARFVRITDLAGTPDVFDLDAVGIVHALCP
ncbi:hypothetical protein [Sorangium sp. So ce513]|uniref:hypothetical protein n=1 Tax=Sorangium sp. So ce513 TaxID=3133315 RepID=UPI003F5DF3E6